jgi:hypothetical protein
MHIRTYIDIHIWTFAEQKGEGGIKGYHRDVIPRGCRTSDIDDGGGGGKERERERE